MTLLSVPAAGRAADTLQPAGLVGVTVVIENLAPPNGTWLTPAWAAFHDGTFDVYDLGAPAGTALERLAEDGDTGPIADLFAASGAGTSQAVMPGDGATPQIAPGETATRTFVLDASDPANRYFSWASMVIPSNDAFVGNDGPQARRIFDDAGGFLGAYVTIAGSDVLDAGTEVNDEVPAHTAFFGQSTPDSGDDEGGVVHAHPGYLPPGSGGILDDPMFAAADFTQPGYDVARITIYRSDTVLSGGNVSGTWDTAGSPYILQGDVTVPAGQTLTIDPGVVVYANEGVGLTVHGTLEALGTEGAPILFTGARNVDVGGNGWTGLRFENATTTSRLEHCTVEYGDRRSTYESGGGVACVASTLEIRSCRLHHNEAYRNGAGIYGSDATLTVEDCDIGDNLIDGANSGEGGGIYCESSTVQILSSRIHDNRVTTFTYFGATNSRGGGISLHDTGGLVAKNVIAGNYLNHSGTEAESAGGGIYVDGGAPVLRGNTVVANEVHYNNAHGGGIYFRGYGARLVDTIVASNVGAGVFFDPGASTVDISYCDVYGNSAGAFAGSYAPPGIGVIVQTNRNGDPCDADFNILEDPRFVSASSGDYHLRAGSPCIDAGAADSPADPDGTIADIGALYFPQETTGVPEAATGESEVLLVGSRPEPMSSATEIVFRNPERGRVRLALYDLRGRLVRTLVDDVRPGGVQRVRFDGRNDRGRAIASGVYFYRILADGREASRKLTILR